MAVRTGNISVNTQNILPIIKKWLYSDKDIFIREMVANGCDAMSKYRKLVSLGEVRDDDPQYRIDVTLDEAARTLCFADTGIGMTADEVEKYITQVAFSGAQEFLEKYEKGDDPGIIGHFGLGFYSAFMVADRVEIDTLSWQAGATPVHWCCTGGEEYEIGDGERQQRGTAITLHIAEGEEEFLDSVHVREVLEKYCGFLPYPIYLQAHDVEPEGEEAAADAAPAETAPDGEPEAAVQQAEGEETPDAEQPINDVHPLWLKAPAECGEQEYKDFYRKVFHTFEEPLFWIHLNVDYPFNLKGILYFPKLKHELDASQGQIKLYNNQVFVADNIKEVIPEFLLLLKGVLDCPDLPLNVSRSFLQNDGYVRKIQAHITRKVADKLTGLFNTQREDYDRYWDDIHPFVKFGCMQDEKFYDRVQEALIYRLTDGRHVTMEQYLEAAKADHENQVYYTSDERQQAAYIERLQRKGIEVMVLNTGIDIHFITFLEMKQTALKFIRVDAELSSALKGEADEEQAKRVQEAFQQELGEMTIKAEALPDEPAAAIILLGERNRRMQEMSAMYGDQSFLGMFPEEKTLVVNLSNPLVQALPEMAEQRRSLVAKQIYDLARLAHGPLEPADMAAFLARTQQLMEVEAHEA